MDFIASEIAAAITLCAIMTLAWHLQRITGNSGWIDVFWTFGAGATGCVLALLPLERSGWPHSHQMLVAALAGSWSLRLGWHILLRTRLVGDDPRYRDLIRHGVRTPSRDCYGNYRHRPQWVCFWLARSCSLRKTLLSFFAFKTSRPSPFSRSASLAKPLLTLSCARSSNRRQAEVRSAKLDCGAFHVIPTIFLSGSAGPPIRFWRSTSEAAIRLDIYRCWRRCACTGC